MDEQERERERLARRAESQYAYMRRRQARSPRKSCECGCGKMIPSLTMNGDPQRFVKGHHNRVQPQRRGPDSHAWHGGNSKAANGYVRAWVDYPEARMYSTAVNTGGNSWWIPRSHLVWNRAHPDDLVQKGEHVHHINRVRDDDQIENLKKMNGREHVRLHGLKAI